MLARVVYTILLYLLTPIVLIRLGLRGLHNRAYWRRWRERFGFAPPMQIPGVIWLHAVSVGEVNALAPLIEKLLARHPHMALMVTTGTPTGSARVRQLFGNKVHHAYLPFDLPCTVRRFLVRTRPVLGIIAETEIWPNLYTFARRYGVPMLIVNARLSIRSMRGFAILPGVRLIRIALASVAEVLAQSEVDAERYIRLGAHQDRVRVVGNMKFDLAPSPALRSEAEQFRRALGPARRIWIAASTHEAEERAVVRAHQRVLAAFPDALLLVAPRHPERFRTMVQCAREAGLEVATRSGDRQPGIDTRCFVVDTLGELMQFYAVADVAFVGGSLAPCGGHNVLEPAALGVPVLVGPHTENFAEIVDALLAAGAARREPDADALGEAVAALLRDPDSRRRMGEAGLRVIQRGRGALEEILDAVERQLRTRMPPISAAR